MKTVEFIWDGKPLYLMLNGTALFDILDRYGSRAEILELIEGNDKKSYLNTCWILSKLAEQGELARRFLGHDHATYPTPERLAALMMPLEVPKPDGPLRGRFSWALECSIRQTTNRTM